MEKGFVRGQSDNLPRIDSITMATYYATNSSFISAEIRGVKASRSARESYGDNAIGYVQVKREGDICTVKARITPEHKVRKTPYHITLICNEKESEISSVQCHDCVASAGGCKHAIAFLAWVHRRTEEPAPTSVKCYWSKSMLSSVGTSLKFVKAKDIVKKKVARSINVTDGSFLKEIIEESNKLNLQTQITKYFYNPCVSIEISIHKLFIAFKRGGFDHSDVNIFLKYCSDNMNNTKCEGVSKQTKKQAECPLWFEMRYARITASKVYDVVHCKTFDGSLVENILGAYVLKETAALKRGRSLEPLVLTQIRKKTKVNFQKCGLLLNCDHPVLGASPDGISEEYCLEIKCPVNWDTFKSYFTSEDKPAKRYMAQVQMQMHFSNRKKSMFCIAHPDFEESTDFKTIFVEYDEIYCREIIEKSLDFWKTAIYPKINT